MSRILLQFYEMLQINFDVLPRRRLIIDGKYSFNVEQKKIT